MWAYVGIKHELHNAIEILEGECGFLAANFCAHSIFGEDALANVCIEKTSPLDPNSPIIGHIRIRAKSQGMALSLGDKVCYFSYMYQILAI